MWVIDNSVISLVSLYWYCDILCNFPLLLCPLLSLRYIYTTRRLLLPTSAIPQHIPTYTLCPIIITYYISTR